MDFTEKTVNKNYIYKGKILSLRRDDALLPSGRPCVREIVEHCAGAAVLYVADGKIAFVRQFRYAYGEAITEIPAGKVEAGEEPIAAAFRELKEEAGVVPETMELLQIVYPSTGYTDEQIFVFLARGGRTENPNPDEGEFLSLAWIDEKKAKEMLTRGEFRDAKTAIALYAYFLRNDNL